MYLCKFLCRSFYATCNVEVNNGWLIHLIIPHYSHFHLPKTTDKHVKCITPLIFGLGVIKQECIFQWFVTKVPDLETVKFYVALDTKRLMYAAEESENGGRGSKSHHSKVKKVRSGGSFDVLG